MAPTMNAQSSPRILLIKLSSFGDVLHALPTLEALRTAYPRARITWLVEEAFAPLLAGHPALDEVWPVPRPRWGKTGMLSDLRALARAAGRLRSRDFDLVIDLQGLLKSALWVGLSKSPRKVGYDCTRELSYFPLTERLAPYDAEAHAVQRYLNVAHCLGAAQGRPKFRLEHLLAGSGKPLMDLKGRPFALLHPGARWPTKLWPAAAWAELAERLAREKGLAVVLTGSLGDRELARDILTRSRAPIRNLAGRTSLQDLAGLMAKAALVVTTDTGPMHLAAALGRRVVALFGPTAPWRTGPFGEGHEIVRLGLDCSPCFRRRCAEPRCLTELPVDRVAAACQRLLSKPQDN